MKKKIIYEMPEPLTKHTIWEDFIPQNEKRVHVRIAKGEAPEKQKFYATPPDQNNWIDVITDKLTIKRIKKILSALNGGAKIKIIELVHYKCY